MPVVGQHKKTVEEPRTPKRIAFAVMLTYERAGLLTRSLKSLRETSPDLHVVVYDDGSESPEKLEELETVEKEMGIHVNRGEHLGFVGTWLRVFTNISCGIDTVYGESDGIVLLEDDLDFAKGWDETLLKMASGVEKLGLKAGSMTCLRCHQEPQAQVVDLDGVKAYQTMQHGFHVNMVPAWVFNERDFWEEAASNSEKGDHGIDIWFIGGLSHRLGLTSFMCEQSWVAHTGASNSTVESQGYIPFRGIGYNLVEQLSAIHDMSV